MAHDQLRHLALTFVPGRVWGTITGIFHIFVIGPGRTIDNQPMEPFYATFQGTFLQCFACMQIPMSYNIRQYVFNKGCLRLEKLFSAFVPGYFLLFVKDASDSFRFAGMIDDTFTMLYLVFSLFGSLRIQDILLQKSNAVKEIFKNHPVKNSYNES